LIYSSALGYNPNIAIEALMAGALASGLSGTGPSVAAVVKKEKIRCVEEAWQIYEGDILRANVNNEKAKVIG
jgi:shikimate kinase